MDSNAGLHAGKDHDNLEEFTCRMWLRTPILAEATLTSGVLLSEWANRLAHRENRIMEIEIRAVLFSLV